MLTGQKPIVVVGSINLDLVTGADRIPAAGETITGNDFQMHPGGKGANQAVAIAKLGYPVEMIGKLGNDLAGDQLSAHLKQAGVGLQGVERVEGASGTAVIVVAKNGENCIVVTPGANGALSPAYVDRHRDLIRRAGVVLCQLEIPLETVEHLAGICAGEGIPLLLDPAPAQSLPSQMLHQVRWFTPNEVEAAFYLRDLAHTHGTTDPHEIAKSILSHGPEGVILKLGSRGAYVASSGAEEHVPARAVKAVDSTAAGDAFNGAFAVGLMSGWSPAKSARFAVTAASISVTRAGAQPSMPTLDEVTAVFGGAQERIDGTQGSRVH